jgi:hypothetical protein
MTTNSYVSNYNEESEQDLQDDLVIEAIQMKGIDMNYLPRTLVSYDSLFGEDPTSAFNNSYVIEMYPANVDGFGGGGDMITNFGLEIKDTATLIVSKTRFSEEMDLNDATINKPQVGDLIYLPLTKSFLSIKHVEDESPFYELGKQYVWEIKTETFDFSYENFATGDNTIDDLINNDILNFDTATDTEEYGDNEDIQTEADTFVDFNVNDPFGVK